MNGNCPSRKVVTNGNVSFPESQPSELSCVALKRQGTKKVPLFGQLCIKYTEKHLQDEKIASLYVFMT